MRGVGWIALGFGARQLITWASMLVPVRLVEPRAFGTLALALAIVSAFQYLRGSGIWAALVYRRDDIEEAAALALCYMIVSSVAVYAAVFAASPLFAHWFHSGSLTAVTRVLALVIPLAGLSVVPGAILERELRYAAGSRVDLGGALAQLVASVGLALAGAGVWSLVAGQVAAAAAETVLLSVSRPWRPRLRAASWRMLRELFTYGRFAGRGTSPPF